MHIINGSFVHFDKMTVVTKLYNMTNYENLMMIFIFQIVNFLKLQFIIYCHESNRPRIINMQLKCNKNKKEIYFTSRL
jgi:hypothetical protein